MISKILEGFSVLCGVLGLSLLSGQVSPIRTGGNITANDNEANLVRIKTIPRIVRYFVVGLQISNKCLLYQ